MSVSDDLPDAAWQSIRHAMERGKLLLGDGSEVELSSTQLSRLFQFVASYQQKRQALSVPLPEGFLPKATGG